MIASELVWVLVGEGGFLVLVGCTLVAETSALLFWGLLYLDCCQSDCCSVTEHLSLFAGQLSSTC